MNTTILPTKTIFEKEDYQELINTVTKLEEEVHKLNTITNEQLHLIKTCTLNLTNIFDCNIETIERLFTNECDIMIESRMMTGKKLDTLSTRVKNK